MASDFFARVDALADEVGNGIIEGRVTVDQVYAAPIERGFWVTGPLAGHTNHPRHGGETHYLRNGLFENEAVYLRNLADHALERDGLYKAMVDNVEFLSAQVEVRAPVEFDHLRRSGHPSVTRNGAVVYDRAPAVHRLSREELDAERGEGIEGHHGRTHEHGH